MALKDCEMTSSSSTNFDRQRPLVALLKVLSASADIGDVERLRRLMRTRNCGDLKLGGDVILPSDAQLKKSQDWSPYSSLVALCEEKDDCAAINELLPKWLQLTKIVSDCKTMLISLDRASLSAHCISHVIDKVWEFRLPNSGKDVDANSVVNREPLRAAKSTQLCLLRCSEARRVLLNIFRHFPAGESRETVVNVSCADEGHSGIACKVGVVETEAKKGKDECGSISHIYSSLFRHYLKIAKNRRDVSEEAFLCNVHLAAANDVIFQLFSTSLQAPCKLICSEASADASFVLYNYARLAHILKAFEEKYANPLPPISEVDFSLLVEGEEWDLVFCFLLRYQETFSSAIDGWREGRFRLQAIPQFAARLAKLFSRYYNRVRVLRDPLPTLLPTMHARLYLLAAVKRLFEFSFDVLGVTPVLDM